MKKKRDPAQISMTEEIIVDLFAGGGGASTGIEIAAGRVVAAAINHDEAAVLLHKTNHPYTEHYRSNVWEVDPLEVCNGRPVGLLWASPDCKHFSKAKGRALRDRHIRALAWVVLRWAAEVRPRVIMLENVEEFTTWGPVRKGKPVKKKAGITFRKWKWQLQGLGYQVEHRELVAADYGAPTSRKRFVLCARCDGRPIVWPERTHAPAGSPEVLSGKCLPWRSAAEILDFSLPCPSIFDTKAEIKAKYGLKAQRPLADNTLRRIICGTDKFTIKSAKPYIVPVGYGKKSSFLMQYHDEKGGKARVNGLEDPLATVDAANRHGLCSVQITEFYGNGRPLEVEKPLRTVTARDREALTVCHLDKYYGGGYSGVGNSLRDPLTTVTAEPRHSLAVVHVQKYYGGIVGSDAGEPLPTVTSVDHNALAAVHVAVFKGKDKGQDARIPLRTITAANEFADVRVSVVKYEEDMATDGRRYGHWPEIRALLNRFCGYELADDELILLNIEGIWYYISDIGLRMLTPRELYNAMGFPPDYIIDRDWLGNEYPKDQQIAKCGNAVCPPMAEAMVRANLPEWCGGKISTMAQLMQVVAV